MYPVPWHQVQTQIRALRSYLLEQSRRARRTKEVGEATLGPNPPHGEPGHRCHEEHIDECVDLFRGCQAFLDTLEDAIGRTATVQDGLAFVLLSFETMQFLHGIGPNNLSKGAPFFDDPDAAPPTPSPSRSRGSGALRKLRSAKGPSSS